MSKGSSSKRIAHSFSRSKKHPCILSKCLTSFQVSCYKGKCKQSTFQRHSANQPSICMFFQTLLLPDLFHIKRAVNLYHKNRLRKSEWCLPSEFFFVVVIVKNNNGLPLSGHTPDSAYTALPVPTCLSLQVSTHQRYEFHALDTFTLETCFVRLWQTLFYYPSNISLFTIWWLGNRTILLSNKINVPATWQNIQCWRGFAVVNVCCILGASLQWDTEDADSRSWCECFIVYVRILIIAFSCHLGQLSLLLCYFGL